MDPIHPIVPRRSDPAAVDPVRRVTRTGEEEPREQPQRRNGAAQQRKPAAPPGVSADGHIDALA